MGSYAIGIFPKSAYFASHICTIFSLPMPETSPYTEHVYFFCLVKVGLAKYADSNSVWRLAWTLCLHYIAMPGGRGGMLSFSGKGKLE